MKKLQTITNITIITAFLGVSVVLSVMSIIKPSDELSFSERRRLAQFPEINFETIMSAEAMKGFNDYSVDQFVFREQLRTLKALFDLNVWRKSDNNEIFTIGDYVFKTEYPLRDGSVKRLCNITNYIYEIYLQDMNVKYAFIPDKNYYITDLSDNHRHLVIDYDAMKMMIRENILAEIDEIELFDTLSIDSYYMTDAHWRQEKIGETAQVITAQMGADLNSDRIDYTPNVFTPFHGAYFGQSALSVRPDELIYLVSEFTESAIVTSVELPGQLLPVYDITQLGGMDSYNVFLLGPQAIIRAENTHNPDGRELIIFRDSFSSSIAPLLLPAYSAVTLVDLRYVTPELIGQFIELNDQDVLFMYSAGIFNNSDSIRAPSQQEFISPFVARAAD